MVGFGPKFKFLGGPFRGGPRVGGPRGEGGKGGWGSGGKRGEKPGRGGGGVGGGRGAPKRKGRGRGEREEGTLVGLAQKGGKKFFLGFFFKKTLKIFFLFNYLVENSSKI